MTILVSTYHAECVTGWRLLTARMFPVRVPVMATVIHTYLNDQLYVIVLCDNNNKSIIAR